MTLDLQTQVIIHLIKIRKSRVRGEVSSCSVLQACENLKDVPLNLFKIESIQLPFLYFWILFQLKSPFNGIKKSFSLNPIL